MSSILQISITIALGIILAFFALWLLAFILTVYRHRRIKRTKLLYEEQAVEKLGGQSYLDIVRWSRGNFLSVQKERNQSLIINQVFQSIGNKKEVNAVGYLFQKKYCLHVDKLHCFDLSYYHQNKASSIFESILERLKIYRRPAITLKCFISSVLEYEEIPKDTEEMLKHFSDICQKNKIGILFLNLDSAPSDLFDSISLLFLHSKNIACTSSDSSFYNHDSFKKSVQQYSVNILPPIDYLSFLIHVSAEFPLHYFSTSLISPRNDRWDKLRFIMASSDNLPFVDLFLSTDGISPQNYFPELFISDIKDGNRILDKTDNIESLYSLNYQKQLATIQSEFIPLLALLTLLPFSVDSSFLNSYCDHLKISFDNAIQLLLAIEVLYKVSNQQYVNPIWEMRLAGGFGLYGENYFEKNDTAEGINKSLFLRNPCTGLGVLFDFARMNRYCQDVNYFYSTSKIKNILLLHLLNTDNLLEIDKARQFIVDYYQFGAKNKKDISFLAEKIAMLCIYDNKRNNWLENEAEFLLERLKELSALNERITTNYYSTLFKTTLKIEGFNKADIFFNDASVVLSALGWTPIDKTISMNMASKNADITFIGNTNDFSDIPTTRYMQ